MSRGAAVRFAKHYVEMVLVMLAGMGVFVVAIRLAAAGTGADVAEMRADAPALYLAGMGFAMTAPMVWWMQRRGHSWAANMAMAGAMAVPTVLALALLASGATDDLETLMGIEHSVMAPAMLVAMWPYRGEYTRAAAGVS